MTLSMSRTDCMATPEKAPSKPVTLFTYLDVWTQRRALARLDVNAL